MPRPDSPQGRDFEEASAKLDEGLKSCRKVLRNYRTALGADQPADPPHAEIQATPADTPR